MKEVVYTEYLNTQFKYLKWEIRFLKPAKAKDRAQYEMTAHPVGWSLSLRELKPFSWNSLW